MATPISKETFEKITDPIVKQDIMFEYIQDMYQLLCKKDEGCKSQLNSCSHRFGKLEDRKKIDMTMSGAFGLVGGLISALLKGKVW